MCRSCAVYFTCQPFHVLLPGRQFGSVPKTLLQIIIFLAAIQGISHFTFLFLKSTFPTDQIKRAMMEQLLSPMWFLIGCTNTSVDHSSLWMMMMWSSSVRRLGRGGLLSLSMKFALNQPKMVVFKFLYICRVFSFVLTYKNTQEK